MMNRQAGTFIAFAVVFGFLTVWLPEASAVETPSATMPLFNIGINQLKGAENVSVVIEIFLLLTVLSIAPAILIMLTSFTRIIIVLSLLRQAMGTQQMPPNQVLIGIALFMTVFIMTPVWQTIHQTALQPYLDKKLDPEKALEAGILPLREFMMKQVREKDLALFVEISGQKRPNSPNDLPITVIVPAFIISELKTAFQIGFLIFIPFLILDMVVSSILLSMGMMMLPPVMISLPFKLMLFVLVDGWNLIVGSLVKSFMM
ncbi:MAG: flagellar type III secretion system pore protein FliP [Desulfatirhabdiaceae bacterium]